jgi:crossover junction endodeoxyribonuclease RusA
MMRLTLPYPLTDNHLHTVAHGRKVLSAAGREYYRQVGQACLVQLVGIPRPLTTRLGVWLEVFAPDHRRRDIANLCKAVGDSLQKAGVYLDDRQIDCWHLVRRDPVIGGQLEVVIIELASETFSF